MKPSTLLATLALFVSFTTAVVAQDDWQLLWSDEFEGGMLDSTFWSHRVGFLGYNGEFQTYTDHPENVHVEDGKLHLAAVRDGNAEVGYTSGRINTMDKVQIKYATVEASIKIPDMKLGLWPAFWTLGQDYSQVSWPASGELDIMEMGQKLGGSLGLGNRRVITAIHWDANGQYVLQDGFLDVPYDLSQDFHTYKMEWQPDVIVMSVDDRVIASYEIASCQVVCPELHQYQFLVLNVAVAGAFTCCEYGFELNDYPNGTAWTMEVDYVRVYGNEHTEIILPAGTTTFAPGATVAPVTGTPTTPPATPSPTSLRTPPPTTLPITTGLPTSVSTNPGTSTATSDASMTNEPTATIQGTDPSVPVSTGSPTAGPTSPPTVATMKPTIPSTSNTALDTTNIVSRATDTPTTQPSAQLLTTDQPSSNIIMEATGEPSSTIIENIEASPTTEPTSTLELLEGLLLTDSTAGPSAPSSMLLAEGATSMPTTEMESDATASPTGDDDASTGDGTTSQVVSSGTSWFHSFQQFHAIGIAAVAFILLC